MRSIEYPNEIADLVVVEYRGASRMGFMVRPSSAGLFRLLMWPEGLAEPELAASTLLDFGSALGPPAHAVIDLRGYRRSSFRSWIWALLRTSESASPTEDLARAVGGTDVVAKARIRVPRDEAMSRTRLVAWSCHQPYDSASDTRAVFQEDALKIMRWYAGEVAAFQPDVIWGQGDTSYSDGTSATDFSNQVYGKGQWFLNPEMRSWLRQEYRSMYRHFWSIDPMRRTMTQFPHLFVWDDHEIHDGWGSEGIDLQPGNQEMFRIAHEVADEYILHAGPRVRPTGTEAHQAYVMGSMATFVFDTRSTRNYEANRDRLISREQFGDFTDFLAAIRNRATLTDLVTCTTVPLVGLLTWATTVATRVPDVLNEILLSGIRDDVRDSWTSPGNLETLNAVLSALRSFMQARPDVRVTNVSGDIHVANAFEIHVTGALAPIYQVTTSAITNRQHAPELVALLTEIGDEEYIDGIGTVSRLWDTVTEPNVLFVEIGSGTAQFDLKVWEPDEPGSRDRQLALPG
jgi:hypothetical protein